MKLLIDANVLLDVLQKREPHVQNSGLIWKLCETGQEDGYISALTFANLLYVMRKELEPEKIKEILQKLALVFRTADLTSADLSKAAEMKWDVYEDALQSAAAERIHADYIITRNVRDFNKSKVVAFMPSEYLTRR